MTKNINNFSRIILNFQKIMIIKYPYQASVLVIIGGYLSGQLVGDLRAYVKTLRNLYPSAIIPPDYVFPIVWTILYYLYGRFLFFSIIGSFINKKKIIALGLIGLGLNYLWTPLFLKNKKIALIIICLQILITIVTIFLLKKEDNQHHLTLINFVYLCWLSFALLLNFQVTR